MTRRSRSWNIGDRFRNTVKPGARTMDDEPVDGELHARVAHAVKLVGGTVKCELLTGIPKSTLSRWTHENGPDIPSQGLLALAEAAKLSIVWMISGHGAPDSRSRGFEEVPLYDVRLAAGVARFSEAVHVRTMVPIDGDLLRQLGRANAEGLAWVEADGDSMEPTIPDGARVLLDLNDTRLREGIFGFRLENDLRVKRLLRYGEGVEILSDNPRYPSERLEGQVLEQFEIIGRAKLEVTFL